MPKRDWYSKKSQVFWTCKAFIEGRTITHRTEIREVKGWRLGAIVHKLKKDYEWPICVEYRGSENIAHYWLSKDCDWRTLKFPQSAAHLLDDAA